MSGDMREDTTRTRFLGAIAAQLPIHRVVAVHLFGAIRQGGTESGVAVIAVDPDEPVPLDDLLLDPDPYCDADVDRDLGEPEIAQSVEEVLAEPVVRADGQVVEPDADDSAYAPEPAGDEDDGDDGIISEAARPAARRFTVYTARYRHTLKGPDRGKWEASVTEEADAPLVTVDAVVRGVSRRSGEADETVRLSGDEFRAALPVPAPSPLTRPAPAAPRS